MSFQLSSTPLEGIDLRKGFVSPRAGAFNCFEGRVRDSHEGKTAVALEYEAYAPLCENEARKIFQEARNAFDIIDVKAVHRTGKLRVGETAVWIGVLAAHRNDSFKACRYVIDELKKRLPVWKKEYYSDGDSGWVCCSHSRAHAPIPRHSQSA
jgi:molybdopterin synthase catalytic subunit